MDNAVALVQAYLRVNGYFTVSEYPVIEATARGGTRTVTDLDLLAFRFPHAGHLVSGPRRSKSHDRWKPVIDPALGAPVDGSDMIVAEVKEGRAELNKSIVDPDVLRAAFVRFGCCSADAAPRVVRDLIRDGRTRLPSGHEARMIVFASTSGPAVPYDRITLGHVVTFLQQHLRTHWEVVRHTEHKDPAFGFLVMLEKALRGMGSLEASGEANRIQI